MSADVELWAAVEDVHDRLHTLLTADQLWDGYRDELDNAVADAGRVLDQLHGIQESRTPDDADEYESSNDSYPTDEPVKRCPRCDTVKSHDEFGRNRSSHDGLQSWCKACVRAYNRRGNSTSDVPTSDGIGGAASQARARRLTEPTGQPVEPDPDSRPPAHASSPHRSQSTLTPLT